MNFRRIDVNMDKRSGRISTLLAPHIAEARRPRPDTCLFTQIKDIQTHNDANACIRASVPAGCARADMHTNNVRCAARCCADCKRAFGVQQKCTASSRNKTSRYTPSESCFNTSMFSLSTKVMPIGEQSLSKALRKASDSTS